MALRKLRPEMASLFVRKFRECNPNDERRQYSLELAMACGGPDAADLFLQLATDRADRTSRHYSKIAAETLAYGHLARRPREFPVNDGLLGWMRAAATSEDRDDRILALAVAGFADGSVAMPLLNHSAFNDPDPGVREAGLRELGRRGDATTLVYLRTNLEALAASHQKLYKPVSSGDTVMLMAPDRAEKVIKDAIEELEDRLQPK